jgi:hypothetical protein
MIFTLPQKQDLHGTRLNYDTVPVNFVVRELRPSFERARSLQGFLGGSGITAPSLPTQNHAPACLAAKNQIHSSDLKEGCGQMCHPYLLSSSPLQNHTQYYWHATFTRTPIV